MYSEPKHRSIKTFYTILLVLLAVSAVGFAPTSALSSPSSQPVAQAANVTLTLYVHEGSASGPIIQGAQVTGQDANGSSFSKTTSSSGYVTITGTPGTWSFTASKSGYQSVSWSQSITTTTTKHAFLALDQVTLTLYVHEGNASGPIIQDAKVTGQDANGASFEETTNNSGYVTIAGAPGDWQFTASKTGYKSVSWSQSITTTGEKHAFLKKEASSLLQAPSLSSPSNEEGNVSLKPVFNWSSVSGANGYWLMVATSPSALPTDPDATSCPECIIDQIVRGTSFTPSSDLDHDTTYYWQVQAFDDSEDPIRQGEYSAQWSFSTEETADVILTLYVHEGSASGPIIEGVQVIGEDANHVSFDETTNNSGYVTITGAPGTWQFTASKDGYQSVSWSQSIAITGQKRAFLQKEVSAGEDRKIIFIQGIDSESGNGDCLNVGFIRSGKNRVGWMVNYLVDESSWVKEFVPSLDSKTDFFYFSYSGKYCQNGDDEPDYQKPQYVRADTCHGVADAADKLQDLVEALVLQYPNARFDIVTHSMGGLVAANWLWGHPKMQDKVNSVVTFDSPLRGVPDKKPFSITRIPTACGTSTSLSWNDLWCQKYTNAPRKECASIIVSIIAELGKKVSFFTIDSTQKDKFLKSPTPIEAVPGDRTTLLRSESRLHCRFDDNHYSVWDRKRTSGNAVNCWVYFTHPEAQVLKNYPLEPGDIHVDKPSRNVKAIFVACAITKLALTKLDPVSCESKLSR